jgi:hypothetical protein
VVDYSLLMVESGVEVFVKEERWLEAILAMVPSPIFIRWWPTTYLFLCFQPPSLCIVK